MRAEDPPLAPLEFKFLEKAEVLFLRGKWFSTGQGCVIKSGFYHSVYVDVRILREYP